MRLIGCTLDPLINRRARINHANPQSSCWRGAHCARGADDAAEDAGRRAGRRHTLEQHARGL